MEENRCFICGIGISEGKKICSQCESHFSSEEELKNVIKRIELFVSIEEAYAAIKAVFNELFSQWTATFQDLWEQLQEIDFYFDKEEIPKTPYFFKSKVRIYDKRPHKQHRIRNNCRKERMVIC